MKVIVICFYVVFSYFYVLNYENTCRNPSIDDLGFKDIKIGSSLSEIKNKHKLSTESTSYFLDSNSCGNFVVFGALSNIIFSGDNKFEEYRITNSHEYTLFNSRIGCIKLFFYLDKLVLIEIRNAFGAMEGYARAFGAETCITTTDRFFNHKELKVLGNQLSLHVTEYYNNKQIDHTATLIYSHEGINNALNNIRNQRNNDF
ncbi:hypothetical protein SAMN00777080_0296 [Aquiflexum balticum DSM 16537]|uniref:Uncharacterized protein n=1 Tax=Aquiflexum balticum DSM 16537 TaxID=758820 RepID=A0A1W2GYI1_9BACT|nr:hypothetical protein [Aquiflexum balticum]SMD41765.1 hypothetical protein SAMN00777080_0296 [Aquiflexum balticum DSM 16537]